MRKKNLNYYVMINYSSTSRHLSYRLQVTPPLPPLSLSLSLSLSHTHTASPMENVSAIANNPCFNPSSFRPKTATVLPFYPSELLLRRNSRRPITLKAALNADTISSSIGDEVVSVEPVYERTPRNRPLRTPHSGFHFDGTPRKFFEGWYFKVSIPECRQSFCFMYSLENPAFPKKLSKLEEAQYGPRSVGVGAQILGADDKFICQFSEESQNFWGDRDELMLGNTFVLQKNMQAPKKEIAPQEFNRGVLEGFQVTPLWHQGSMRDDGRNDFAEIVNTARWAYSTRPVYGWGNVGSKQKSTAGWLAVFPVFEPHWQVCMAGGLSTGWIEWGDKRYEFKNAPSYSEKNWGAGFPRKWFWVQCNVFEGADGEVALTACGGLRQLPGLGDTFENVALVGVHYGGVFYEFVPWNGTVSWEVDPWGHWFFFADNETHMVEVEVTTKDSGTPLRAPTSEAGFTPACKDTCFGDLRMRMWERRYDGSEGKVILDVTSNMAAAEVGGGPWFCTWKGKTNTPEMLTRVVGLPVDVEGIFSLAPFHKPPGL